MKLLLVSDLHYALKQFDWATRVAGGFDLVIVAGDHIDIAGHVDGGVQVVVILKYLRMLMARTRVAVSSGNHDLDTREADGEKVARWIERVRQLGIATDGDSIVLGDMLVTICPWWDGERAKASVRALLARESTRRPARWSWVYHAPPQGSPIAWDGRQHHGDSELVELIGAYAPDMVFCGHIHQAPFKNGGSWADRIGATWVFNCGQQIGPVPAHIMIDTEAREAVWSSLAGTEIVPLDQPLSRPFAELTRAPAWLPAPAA